MCTAICYTMICMVKIMINVRITPEEHEILKKAAAKAGRTKTEIIRELIRSLESAKRGKQRGTYTGTAGPQCKQTRK